jgi:regulator of protease activity HflC (stomatin/prohibitin superfamily)
MMKVITVSAKERVAHLRDGELVAVYGPGKHWVWTIWGVNELVKIDVSAPLVPIARGDPLPEELPGARLVEVAPWERLVVKVSGQVRQALNPGRYRLWDESAELIRYDLRNEPTPLSPEDRLEPAPVGLRELSASPSQAIVVYRDGQPHSVRTEGRYRVWDGGPWALYAMPMGLRTLDVAAQDLVTRDQVPVRVKPAATVRVIDPITRLREADADNQAYGAVQLALREAVASRSLEELVTDRDALSADLLARSRANLPAVGYVLERVYVKDVVLPGEIKDLVNRVTLARMEAEAIAIKRREEVAATRQLANTAKLLESNPVLLRLKELEAMGELVGKIDKLVVVGSPELARMVTLRDVD